MASPRTNSCTSLRNHPPRMSPSPFRMLRSPNSRLNRARELITDQQDLNNERQRGGNMEDIMLAACFNISRPNTPIPLSRKIQNLRQDEERSSPHLRSSRSMFHLNDHNPDDTISSYDGEGSRSTLEARDISYRDRPRVLRPGPSARSAEEPYMLVPKVIVTPEIKVLDSGVTTL